MAGSPPASPRGPAWPAVRLRTRWAALLTLGLLTLLHAAWLWPVLTGEAALYLRDLLSFVVPYKAEAGRALARMEWPVLSQALLGGMPLWAHPSAEIADPTTLLFAILADPFMATGWMTLLHGVAAGMGAFLLARSLLVSPWVAVWCALAYAGCGPVLSAWCIKAVPSVALPYVAVVGAVLARRIGIGVLVGGTVAVAFMMLHPDPPAVAAGAAFAAVLLWARVRPCERVRRFARLVAVGVLGAMLSGAFLWPALRVITDSLRWDLADWSAATSLGWRWIEVLAPNGLGVPGALGSLGGPLRHLPPSTLYTGSLYLGATVLVGLGWSLASLRRWKRVDTALCLLLVAGLLLAHGDAVPILGRLWSALHARLPEKLLMPVYLAAILLAGRGFVRAVSQPVTAGLRVVGFWAGVGLLGFLAASPVASWIVGGFADRGAVGEHERELLAGQLGIGCSVLVAAAMACGLAVWRYPRWLPALLVLLACVEGSLSAGTTLLTAPRASLEWRESVAGQVAAPGAGILCCDPFHPLNTAPVAHTPSLPPHATTLEIVQRHGGASAVIHGRHQPVGQDTGGFDPTVNRQALQQGLPALERVSGHGNAWSALRVLSRWGVEWLVTLAPWRDSVVLEARKVDRDVQPSLWLHHLANPAPRVMLTNQWVVETDMMGSLLAMAGDGGVVLESDPGFAGHSDPPPILKVVETRDTRVRATVESNPGGTVLVHASLLRDGWSATVDGQPVPVIRANLLHMAVVLAPGTTAVELRYRMPGGTTGTVMSMVSLLLLGGWCWWLARKQRRDPTGRVP